jgi:hypothetical protein
MTAPMTDTPTPEDERVRAIQERVAKRTPGQWKWSLRARDDDAPGSVYAERFEGHAYAVAMCPRYAKKEQFTADADFIAHAPDDIAWLLADNAKLRSSLSVERARADRAEQERVDVVCHDCGENLRVELTPVARADSLRCFSYLAKCDTCGFAEASSWNLDNSTLATPVSQSQSGTPAEQARDIDGQFIRDVFRMLNDKSANDTVTCARIAALAKKLRADRGALPRDPDATKLVRSASPPAPVSQEDTTSPTCNCAGVYRDPDFVGHKPMCPAAASPPVSAGVETRSE